MSMILTPTCARPQIHLEGCMCTDGSQYEKVGDTISYMQSLDLWPPIV